MTQCENLTEWYFSCVTILIGTGTMLRFIYPSDIGRVLKY